MWVKDRASRVIVGDKMGLESVYHHANGISGGSTREAAGKNDILEPTPCMKNMLRLALQMKFGANTD